MTDARDFRAISRKGRRVSNEHTILHVVSTGSAPSRFGFIVTKAVGGAVVRNRVRRRLRAACYSLLPALGVGNDVVIRALPASAEAEWSTLQSEIARGLGSIARRS
ncbi:ribonuclease P protein component [Antiquaquibacter oligotrophicus]|uniref:ribonuclease P protein component n=1 Tax=Antiquaquibacter oligotrophicus TaxID=2880260 RepID=UPI002AC95652|nr:ribonuclease P protein component [Antiquaquibacter oligotrophicus]